MGEKSGGIIGTRVFVQNAIITIACVMCFGIPLNMDWLKTLKSTRLAITRIFC